jgi:hypothetical protein
MACASAIVGRRPTMIGILLFGNICMKKTETYYFIKPALYKQ